MFSFFSKFISSPLKLKLEASSKCASQRLGTAVVWKIKVSFPVCLESPWTQRGGAFYPITAAIHCRNFRDVARMNAQNIFAHNCTTHTHTPTHVTCSQGIHVYIAAQMSLCTILYAQHTHTYSNPPSSNHTHIQRASYSALIFQRKKGKHSLLSALRVAWKNPHWNCIKFPLKCKQFWFCKKRKTSRNLCSKQ